MLGHDFNSWGVETRRGSIPPLRRLTIGLYPWLPTESMTATCWGQPITDLTPLCHAPPCRSPITEAGVPMRNHGLRDEPELSVMQRPGANQDMMVQIQSCAYISS